MFSSRDKRKGKQNGKKKRPDSANAYGQRNNANQNNRNDYNFDNPIEIDNDNINMNGNRNQEVKWDNSSDENNDDSVNQKNKQMTPSNIFSQRFKNNA